MSFPAPAFLPPAWYAAQELWTEDVIQYRKFRRFHGPLAGQIRERSGLRPQFMAQHVILPLQPRPIETARNGIE
jgi:hypothetical protein